MNDFIKENKWDIKYEEGKSFEEFILEIIQKKYPNSYMIKSDDYNQLKKYDICVPEINMMIECKNDIESETTKNICIEYSQDGEKSGILVTTADYWIIKSGNNILFTKTRKIKDLIYNFYEKMLNDVIENKIVDNVKILIRKLENYPVKQESGRYKLMGLYLIPIDLFSTISDKIIKI